MAMNKVIILVLMLVLMLIGGMSIFTVKQTERAIKLQFGKVVSAYDQPGLYFKYPIIQHIRKFDARIQNLDANPEKFLTAEKKNLIVDSYVKWRIDNVITYFTAVGGDPQQAGQRLAEIIADGLRSEFGKSKIQDVVSGSRAKIMETITNQAKERAHPMGIEIIDVRIKRIELPKEVSSSVYRRMEAERERTAKELRSRGEAEAVRIQAEADRKRVVLMAEAERDAEQIRGEGDARAAEIYALAYGKNPEFYALYRSLTAYKKIFKDNNDILLLQPDSEFFKYFKKFSATEEKQKPQ
jgi:membrane protease subunit HflC